MADPRILAIESATEGLSVAFLEGERVIAERIHAERTQHASALLPEIDALLRDVGGTLDDLDALAVSVGPGSFTSVRIGLATAKGLAFGRSLTAVAVSTLEAMALSVLEDDSAVASDTPVLALIDARRGEWYAGAWAAAREEEAALPIERLREGLYAATPLAQRIRSAFSVVTADERGWRPAFEECGKHPEAIITGAEGLPRAGWVGRLGARRLAAGEGAPAAELTARYLRRAEAEAKRLGGPVESGVAADVDSSPS